MNRIFNLNLSPQFEPKLSRTYFGKRSECSIYWHVLGSTQLGNFIWATFLMLGGIGFSLVGFTLYITSKFYASDSSIAQIPSMTFFPQGALLTFYGSVAFVLSIFIGLTIYWNVGAGYNDFNKTEQLIRIQRATYPNNNRFILLTYEISDIKSLAIKVTEGINPTQVIYLCLKNERQIPITFSDQLPSINKTEQRATRLCNFLDVPLEIKIIKTT